MRSVDESEDESWRGEKGPLDTMIVNEAQLILAEKRTALSAMRTGIAVFALPLSVLGLLVATSKYYDVVRVMPFLLPLLVLSAVLALLGGYLIIHSIFRIRHYDRLIMTIKRKHSRIGELIDWRTDSTQ